MKYIWCFWNDLYINKWKLQNEKDYKTYQDFGNDLILSGLKKGHKIPKIINTCKIFLDKIKERKQNKLAIYRSDHLLAVQSIFALIKLNQYTEEDLLLIMNKHKKKTKSKSIN